MKAATVYNVIDEKIVNQAISIRKKHKVKTADAIIAATALVNGLILITRNTRDFIKIENLILINPWKCNYKMEREELIRSLEYADD